MPAKGSRRVFVALLMSFNPQYLNKMIVMITLNQKKTKKQYKISKF
jgi:hypothetical protein